MYTHAHVHSIDLVGDTAQLAKIADGSIKKLKLRSRTSSPVNSQILLDSSSILISLYCKTSGPIIVLLYYTCLYSLWKYTIIIILLFLPPPLPNSVWQAPIRSPCQHILQFVGQVQEYSASMLAHFEYRANRYLFMNIILCPSRLLIWSRSYWPEPGPLHSGNMWVEGERE